MRACFPFLCVLLWALPSLAAAAGSDIISFRDGGFVRGTIIELDPNAEVVIEMADGRTKRFDMATVSYAGPAQELPAEAPPQDDLIELRLEPSDSQNLQFYRFVNRQDYKALCARPCTVSLPPGALRLGAGIHRRTPTEGNLLQVERDGRVQVQYKDRRAQRIAGAVTGIAGATVAATLFMASLVVGTEQRVTPLSIESSFDADPGLAAGSIGVAIGAGAAALFLLFREDVVVSRYRPVNGE